jgi:pimeloyl-ACP methyl ester carboxylesterase
MLRGLHFLLTYRCIFECDHCFVYSGPSAPARAFNPDQFRAVLDEARRIGTIATVYFEGGEAFLLYPVLLACARLARERGFDVGIVTNAFFATDEANAELFLRPLVELGISDLSLSEDAFHNDLTADTPPAIARRVAERLGLPAGTICVEAPHVEAGKPGVALAMALSREIVQFRLGRAALLAALRRVIAAGAAPYTPDDLKDWPGILLLVFGSDDPGTPPDVREAMQRLYPRAEVRVFEGSGHTLAASRQEEYYQIIGDFLAG